MNYNVYICDLHIVSNSVVLEVVTNNGLFIHSYSCLELQPVNFLTLYMPGVHLLCDLKSFIFFNFQCTYHTESSEGSELEKAAYALNTKQKIVKLVNQWVALCGSQLKEDPLAFHFLEVRFISHNILI